jgi:putative aminopeptidase FrvX
MVIFERTFKKNKIKNIMKKEDLKSSTFKVGDIVRIKQPTQEYKRDCEYGWVDAMDDMVGEVYPIEAIYDSDNSFRVNSWSFSLDSLEKVEVDTLQVSMEEQISDFVEYLNERHEKEKEEKKKNKIKLGDIVCVLDNYVEIIPQDILSQFVDIDKISLPKVGQIAEVIGKAKNNNSKYLMLAYHDEIYILEKHQVIKTYPQSTIL